MGFKFKTPQTNKQNGKFFLKNLQSADNEIF
jgi:hypothetical protein